MIFFGYSQGMSDMESVRACGGCHAMTAHVADLQDPNSDSLAAVHVVHHVAGTYTVPIKIAHPYSNIRCLTFHGGSQKFMKSDGHPAEIQPQLMSGQESCLTCHAPAHTPKEAKR